MRNVKEEAIQFERDELRKLYNQLSIKQQNFFNRLWGSVDKIPDESIHIGSINVKEH